MNAESIKALIASHAWIPLLAVIIGLVIRLLKADTKIPLTIPSRYRTPLVYVLGLAVAVLEKVGAGTSWEVALIDGALAALGAQQGHLLLVESLRGGKEVTLPGLIIPGASPSPNKPATIPPAKPRMPPTLPIILVLVAVLGTFSISRSNGDRALAAAGGGGALLVGCNRAQLFDVLSILADKTKCAVANQDLTDEQIVLKCALGTDRERVLPTVREARAASAKAVAASRVGACGPGGSK